MKKIIKTVLKYLNKMLLNPFGLSIVKKDSVSQQKQTFSDQKFTDRDNIWKNRKLNWNDKGYWFVEPMPTMAELDKYYQNSYWEDAGGKKQVVGHRDINHYLEIKSLYPEKKFTKILNFGAGHGGISVIFHLVGATAVNVEPSGIDVGFKLKTFIKIEEIEDCDFDLIYGSHSLEHVIDVESFFKKAESLLKKDGIFYFEVPNCHENGKKSYPNGKIRIPHTYYFTRSFFEKLPYQKVLNATYLKNSSSDYVKMSDDTGKVLRYSAVKNF